MEFIQNLPPGILLILGIIVVIAVAYVATKNGLSLGPLKIFAPKTSKIPIPLGISYTWNDTEDKNVAIRVRAMLIQTFGILNSGIHNSALNMLQEIWPLKYKSVIIDITDSNVPSMLLGMIASTKEQRVIIICNPSQRNEIAVLKGYHNIKILET